MRGDGQDTPIILWFSNRRAYRALLSPLRTRRITVRAASVASIILNIIAGLIFAGTAALHFPNGRIDLSTGLYGILAFILLAYAGLQLANSSNK